MLHWLTFELAFAIKVRSKRNGFRKHHLHWNGFTEMHSEHVLKFWCRILHFANTELLICFHLNRIIIFKQFWGLQLIEFTNCGRVSANVQLDAASESKAILHLIDGTNSLVCSFHSKFAFQIETFSLYLPSNIRRGITCRYRFRYQFQVSFVVSVCTV